MFRKLYASPVGKAFRTLDHHAKRKLSIISGIQTLMGFLDLAGVVLFGALGALFIQGVQSSEPGDRVSAVLNILRIENLTFQKQAAVLGCIAALLLIFKTIISAYFTRRIFFFLSNRSALMTENIISKVLSQDLTTVQKRSSQEILYIATDGVKNVMTGLIATSVTMFSDFMVLLILLVGLFIVDPTIAIATSTVFFLAGIILNHFLHVRARKIGLQINHLVVDSNEKILEVLNTFRESVVRSRRSYYASNIKKIRSELGGVNAELNFQPYIGKYVIEAVSVFGLLILAAYEFSTKSAVHAVAVIAVFMAASSRIAPAALRIQQGILMIKTSSGSAFSTLTLIDEINQVRQIEDTPTNELFDYQYFYPEVLIKDVKFNYPTSEKFALENINLHIEPGWKVAIVGPSGAGKSTLIDLLLGVLKPNAGEILISGVAPLEAANRWAGAISYVPQNISISNATVRENVSMGYENVYATDQSVSEALETAKLTEVVASYPEGLDANLGENGTKMSGGQRQRLGLARALFTKPKLLVLDEATSALDGLTEAEISKALETISKDTTLLIVAHRLSTVLNSDQVIYMEDGKIICMGTFEEVRNKVLNFDKQAKLMGL